MTVLMLMLMYGEKNMHWQGQGKVHKCEASEEIKMLVLGNFDFVESEINDHSGPYQLCDQKKRPQSASERFTISDHWGTK